MTTVFRDLALEAREAAQCLALLKRADKDAALFAMASALLSAEEEILSVNLVDVSQARLAGTSEALIDRLLLNPERLAGMALGLRELAALSDPVGEVLRGWQLANGVSISQVRVPLGVVGIIYEARPNVTADAAGICLKSGNAALLRGSSSSLATNQAIVLALRRGLASVGLPEAAVCLVEGDRQVTTEMMQAHGLVDVLIPRGGLSLIETVVRQSSVPVIETGAGNCHLFVDSSADADMALEIALNAKTQRPTVCNAIETVLVDQAIAATFVPRLAEAMVGVELFGNAVAAGFDSRIQLTDEWDREFYRLALRIAVVDDLDAAIDFIRAHGSGHSETIVTNDLDHQQRFVAGIDAACLLVNTSSRLIDGGQFGFGAEIGISTNKLHARGPMGLAEMTTTKYVLVGSGQIRE